MIIAIAIMILSMMIINLNSFPHSFDALGVHEVVVKAVHCVVHCDVALPELVKIMKMIKIIMMVKMMKLVMMIAMILTERIKKLLAYLISLPVFPVVN